MNEGSSCSTSSPELCIVSFLNFSCFRCVVVFHCCLELYFPNAIWCSAYFHMLHFHLFNFITKVSVQIFCLFLNWEVSVIVEFYVLIVYSRYRYFVRYVIHKPFLPVCVCLLLDSVFHRAEDANFNKVQLINLFFYGLCFCVVSKKSSPNKRSPIFSLLSSRNFLVLHLYLGL